MWSRLAKLTENRNENEGQIGMRANPHDVFKGGGRIFYRGAKVK